MSNNIKYRRPRENYRWKIIIACFSVFVFVPVSVGVYILISSNLDITVEQPKTAIPTAPPTKQSEDKNTATRKPENNEFQIIYLPADVAPFLTEKRIKIEDTSTQFKFIESLITKLQQYSSEGSSGFRIGLRNCFIHKETLVVDLDKASMDHFKGKELNAIQSLYAISNTLLHNLPFDKLLLLFEGERATHYDSIFNLDTPLRFNHALVTTRQKG